MTQTPKPPLFSTPQRFRIKRIVFGALVLCALILVGTFAARFLRPTSRHSALKFQKNEPSVGAPARITLSLDRPDYTTTPDDDSAPMWVHIEKIEPKEDGSFLYHLSYAGMESGIFNLTDYLQKSATERLSEPVTSVGVRSAIPEGALYDFGDLLASAPPKVFPYSKTVGLLGALWLGWGVWLMRQRRLLRTGQADGAHPEDEATQDAADAGKGQAAHQKKLSDVLRPLVQKAALKTISTKEKALMEHILFLYWGKKLELDHLDDAEQLRRILDHEEAGELLRTVEQWLYQPAAAISAEAISDTLEPYMQLDMKDLPELAADALRAAQSERSLLAHA